MQHGLFKLGCVLSMIETNLSAGKLICVSVTVLAKYGLEEAD
jgi:hypothetical protein